MLIPSKSNIWVQVFAASIASDVCMLRLTCQERNIFALSLAERHSCHSAMKLEKNLEKDDTEDDIAAGHQPEMMRVAPPPPPHFTHFIKRSFVEGFAWD